MEWSIFVRSFLIVVSFLQVTSIRYSLGRCHYERREYQVCKFAFLAFNTR